MDIEMMVVEKGTPFNYGYFGYYVQFFNCNKKMHTFYFYTRSAAFTLVLVLIEEPEHWENDTGLFEDFQFPLKDQWVKT